MSQSALAALSEELQNLIQKTAESTVGVSGRHHHPISGVVYDTDLIVTAGHALEWNDEIRVLGPGSDSLIAEVAGWDSISDLTVLKVPDARLKAAVPATELSKVGQLVLALARDKSGIQAGSGIISAVGGPMRLHHGGQIEQVLRSDAVRWPNFSGGPLVDDRGGLVGVNLFGHHRETFTVPAALAWKIAQNLIENGSNFQGYLGIRSQPVALPAEIENLGREQKSGLLLVGIESESPADKAGLIVGDILVGLGGDPVSDHDQLMAQLSGHSAGKETSVDILRGGRLEQHKITVGNRSESGWGHARRRCC